MISKVYVKETNTHTCIQSGIDLYFHVMADILFAEFEVLSLIRGFLKNILIFVPCYKLLKRIFKKDGYGCQLFNSVKKKKKKKKPMTKYDTDCTKNFREYLHYQTKLIDIIKNKVFIKHFKTSGD